jgi:hypothetical protein
MRPARTTLAALALILALTAAGICASNCTTLTGDCDLNLDCPGMPQPMCSGILDPGDCDTCMQGYCCAEVAACYSDQECLYGCLEGFYPPDPECASPPSLAPFQAILACMAQSCAAACAVADDCNPVNSAGCAPGEQCDADYPGVFECAENEGSLAELCQPCDPVNSPYCDVGLHCFAGSHTCARFCCTDADCGSGTCELDQTIAFTGPLPLTTETVGVCVVMLDGGADGGADGGMASACDAPAVPPSNGSCAPQFQE